MEIYVQKRNFMVYSALTADRVGTTFGSVDNWISSSLDRFVDDAGNTFVLNFYFPTYPRVFRVIKRRLLLRARIPDRDDKDVAVGREYWVDNLTNQIVDNSGNYLWFSIPAKVKTVAVRKRDFRVTAKVKHG